MITAQIIGGKLPSCTYCGTAAVGPATASTATFTGRSIGSEDPTRYVVVGVVSLTTSAVSSVTVAGAAATFLGRAGAVGSGILPVELWGVSVPIGTTATIVVTTPTSLTFFRAAITVWALINLRSTVPLDVVTSTASPGSATLATRPKGFVLALAQTNANAGTFAWGASGEDYQINVNGSGVITRSGLHAVAGVASSTVSVTYSPASSPALVAASWR